MPVLLELAGMDSCLAITTAQEAHHFHQVYCWYVKGTGHVYIYMPKNGSLQGVAINVQHLKLVNQYPNGEKNLLFSIYVTGIVMESDIVVVSIQNSTEDFDFISHLQDMPPLDCFSLFFIFGLACIVSDAE